MFTTSQDTSFKRLTNFVGRCPARLVPSCSFVVVLDQVLLGKIVSIPCKCLCQLKCVHFASFWRYQQHYDRIQVPIFHLIMEHLVFKYADAADRIFRLWDSILCMLMHWLLKSLEHQQAWYWLCITDIVYLLFWGQFYVLESNEYYPFDWYLNEYLLKGRISNFRQDLSCVVL